MAKKSLVLYASMTGNTEKVALRFKKVFDKNGWECDVFKIEKNTDLKNPPFDYHNYDFLCVGSPVIASLPVKDVIEILRLSPMSPHAGRPDIAGASMEEMLKKLTKHRQMLSKAPPEGAPRGGHAKIVFGPNDKKGIVFVTLAGQEFGLKEALPALTYLESEMEHLRFQCMGRFACPGRFGKAEGWFKDLVHRPSERDLLKAEIFLEEILEELDEHL